MGNASDNNRGHKGIASQASAERRFTEALKKAAGGKPLDEEGLAERRELIAEIAKAGPKKPTFTKAADFIEERKAGVEPLDAIFPREDGWER